MKLLHEELTIWTAGKIGLGYQLRNEPYRRLGLGEVIPPESAANLPIADPRLSERYLAFLALVILDARGNLSSTVLDEKSDAQRLRFADHLGMTEPSFRRWLARSLPRKAGSILSWERTTFRGNTPSRTGGPWSLAVKRALLYPDAQSAMDFVAKQHRVGFLGRVDPSILLTAARQKLAVDNWPEALLILEEAQDMFMRSRWPRDRDLWFEIRLNLGHAQMQVGLQTDRPNLPDNIQKSISIQGLYGPDVNAIRARAYYLAALMLNQRDDDDAAKAAIEQLERAEDVLRTQKDDSAIQRNWSVRAYRELSLARLNRVAQARESSVILQASEILDPTSDELRMRYGESLIVAGQPSRGLEYIVPARDSGRLSSPAWIIAERLISSAKWAEGSSMVSTLDRLEEVEKEAARLGFDHQVRLIRKQRKLVEKRIRSVISK